MTTSKYGKDKATKKVAKKKAAPAPPESDELKFMVDSARERRTTLTPEEMEGSTRPVVERVIERMEAGDLRVAEPDGKGGWIVNEWLKKAVLLYFRVQDMELVESYPSPFWDKIPLRFEEFDEAAFRKLGVRVVTGVIARRGSFIGKDVVLMPSFVTIGAHIGSGTLVATWTTIGSCAQVGTHCHISGGPVFGRLLALLQASPNVPPDPVLTR